MESEATASQHASEQKPTTVKSSAASLVGGKPTTQAPTSEIVQKSLLALAESSNCPKQIAPYLVKAAPFVGKA
eukprot:gene21815-16278_t